jgi:hypothetical protein
MELQETDSSLISEIEYDEKTLELTIHFRKYFVDKLTYERVPPSYFEEFTIARSFGRFYLHMIKPNFSLKKSTQKMADRIIKCKINVREVIKEWIFAGEKGDYLNFTVLQNDEQDGYGNNGMIVQDVPTEIYKKDKSTKGPILGNCKIFASQGAGNSEEVKPGVESGKLGGSHLDDLPF